MFKDLLDTLNEWVPAVPGRWYRILLSVIPIIPFITGLIIAIEQSTEGIPVPAWVWVMIIIGAVAFVVVSFFAFHRVRLERYKIMSTELKRQERKEWRRRFSNVIAIPSLLLGMYELAKELCKQNKMPLTKEYWKEIADSFFGAHQAPTVVPTMDKMPSVKEIMEMINSTPNPFNISSGSMVENLNRLILNIQATMSFHNTGAIPLTNNSVLYGAKHTAVKLLQQNLPNEINAKIESCILLSNGLANLLCVDFSNTETKISEELLITMQYMLTCMDNLTQKMRGEIATMIENFLLGE
ncbi:MAG: DUF4231 domain-containing protein [Euryarchaeota archaeon]|nr:DUF4231 domain-containing protein [Euryarchaeota archaeon]